jgi:hypothetical protein
MKPSDIKLIKMHKWLLRTAAQAVTENTSKEYKEGFIRAIELVSDYVDDETNSIIG